HELCGARSLLICVVEDHAAYAPEDVLKVEAEFRVGFQTSLKVGSQGYLADYLALRRPQQLGGDGRSQLHGVVIVGQDRIQIVRVPGGDPMVGEIPGVVFCHSVSLGPLRPTNEGPGLTRNREPSAGLKAAATKSEAWACEFKKRRRGGASRRARCRRERPR